MPRKSVGFGGVVLPVLRGRIVFGILTGFNGLTGFGTMIDLIGIIGDTTTGDMGDDVIGDILLCDVARVGLGVIVDLGVIPEVPIMLDGDMVDLIGDGLLCDMVDLVCDSVDLVFDGLMLDLIALGMVFDALDVMLDRVALDVIAERLADPVMAGRDTLLDCDSWLIGLAEPAAPATPALPIFLDVIPDLDNIDGISSVANASVSLIGLVVLKSISGNCLSNSLPISKSLWPCLVLPFSINL